MSNIDEIRGKDWWLMRINSSYMIERKDPVNPGGYMRLGPKFLKRWGYEVLIPTRTRWQLRDRFTRKKDRKRVTVPLMPGYLFLRPLNERDGMRWHLLERNAPWISSIVHDGHRVLLAGDRSDDRRTRVDIKGVPVPPKGLTFVLDQHRENADEQELYMRTNATFAIGDLVEVCDDAFESLAATVVEIEGQRTRVKAEFFGSERDMWVETEKLSKRAA